MREKRTVSCNQYYITFLQPFKNGMKWNDKRLIHPKDGIYSVVGGTKSCIHLVPQYGSMYDKISVPRNKIKIVRRIKEYKIKHDGITTRRKLKNE